MSEQTATHNSASDDGNPLNGFPTGPYPENLLAAASLEHIRTAFARDSVNTGPSVKTVRTQVFAADMTPIPVPPQLVDASLRDALTSTFKDLLAKETTSPFTVTKKYVRQIHTLLA